MANAMSLTSEGFVETKLEGTLTGASLFQLILESLPYSAQLGVQGKDIKLLVDTQNLISFDATAIKRAQTGASTLAFDKIAFFGANAQNENMLNMIFNQAGKNQHVQFFKTRDDAVVWLRSG